MTRMPRAKITLNSLAPPAAAPVPGAAGRVGDYRASWKTPRRSSLALIRVPPVSLAYTFHW